MLQFEVATEHPPVNPQQDDHYYGKAMGKPNNVEPPNGMFVG